MILNRRNGQGPLQRAASRLAHVLSLLWVTSSAAGPLAATGATAAVLPESGEPIAGHGTATMEISNEIHS